MATTAALEELIIAPDDIRFVFDPFWQGERADARAAGLGPDISKGLVEVRGCRIEIESEVSMCTTFRVTLPLPGVV